RIPMATTSDRSVSDFYVGGDGLVGLRRDDQRRAVVAELWRDGVGLAKLREVALLVDRELALRLAGDERRFHHALGNEDDRDLVGRSVARRVEPANGGSRGG